MKLSPESRYGPRLLLDMPDIDRGDERAGSLPAAIRSLPCTAKR